MSRKPAPPPKQERKPKSNATFWRDGDTLHDHAYWGAPQSWYWRRAGWKKAAAWTVGILLTWAFATHRTATEWALALIGGPAAGVGIVAAGWAAVRWKHNRNIVRPLHWALAPILGLPPGTRPDRYLTVPLDYADSPDTEIVVDVPPDFTGAGHDIEDITRAVVVKLAIENPQVTPKLGGRHPRVVITKSQPPPLEVWPRDILPAVGAAKPSEVILGFGVPSGGKPQVISIDLDSETPHNAASMSTGDGKSAFVRNFAPQLAHNGTYLIICDYKWFSHMWADGLPNVLYCRTPQEIHEVLVWLAYDQLDGQGNVIRPSELTRRKAAGLSAERGYGPTGFVRFLLIAEEQNSTAKALRRYWRAIGGKGPCPSLEALDEVGATGRQLKVNILYLAQRLSARVSGSDGTADARENIGALIMKDPNEATWKMLAAGHSQPPRSGHKGRYQLVTRSEVREFQGALWTDEEAREFAISGQVAVPPFDLPFATRQDLVPAVMGQAPLASQGPSDQAFVVGQDAPVLPAAPTAVRAATLAEAVEAGLFVSLQAARKVPQRQGWEPVGGDKTTGYQYALTDLYAYVQGRGRR